MHKNNSIFLFLLFPVLLFGQDNFDAPPGTVKLSDDLYIDEVPVTNLMYLEFLSSVESFWNTEMHQRIQGLPKYGVDPNFRDVNTKQTERQQNFLRTSDQDRMRHPECQEDPVVQISKREAELFCRWRTDMVLLLWAIRSQSAEERTKYPAAIRYRLPKAEEYKSAEMHFSALNKLGKRNNFPSAHKSNRELSGSLVFYDLAEITYDNGIYREKEVSQETLPNDSVGFRCVCEVEK